MGSQSKLMPCPLRQWTLTDSQHCLLKLSRQSLSGNIPEYVSAGLLDCWVEQYRQAMAEQSILAGDRLAVITLSPLDTVILAVACWRSGVVFCPVNPAFPPGRLLAYFDKIDASVVFSPDESLCGELRCLQLPVKAEKPHVPVDTALSIDANAMMDLIATSGSTGVPKAVAHSYANHYYSAVGSLTELPLGSGDSWLLSLPLFHVGGFGIVVRALLAGATLVFYEKAQGIAAHLGHSEVTHLSLVNTQLYRLLQDDEVDFADVSVKYILLGGGVASPELVSMAQKQGVTVLTTYGMTEMSSQVCTGVPIFTGSGLTSGRPLQYRQLSLNTEGEIMVRGVPLSMGYFHKGNLTLLVDKLGWYHTGDRGSWHEDQILINGRLDNMMISGGENIHPEEIEQALLTITGVIQAVVVPIRSQEFGQRPVAYVQIESGELNELYMKQQLAGKIAKFKIPDKICLFPASDVYSGIKVNRQLFRQLAERQMP